MPVPTKGESPARLDHDTTHRLNGLLQAIASSIGLARQHCPDEGPLAVALADAAASVRLVGQLVHTLAPDTQRAKDPAKKSDRPPRAGRVLLVESSSPARDTVASLLSDAGYSVICSADRDLDQDETGIDVVVLVDRDGDVSAATLASSTGGPDQPPLVAVVSAAGAIALRGLPRVVTLQAPATFGEVLTAIQDAVGTAQAS